MINHIEAIIGNEPFLINKELEKLITESGVDKNDIITYDMDESSLVELLEELQTIPFLVDFKFIVVKNPKFLNHSLKDNKELKEMLEYFKNPYDTNYLIFIINFEGNSKEACLYKELKKYVRINKADSLESHEIDAFIKRSFREANLEINDVALSELRLRTNDSLMLIEQEIAKLILYKMDSDNEINFNDIVEITPKNLEDKIYDLTSALLVNDNITVFRIYEDLIISKEDPITIINSIANKTSELFMVKNLIENGYNQAKIAEFFHVSSGRAYYMEKEAKLVRMSILKDTIGRIANLDYKIKSGKIDKKVGLDLFLQGC